MTDEAALIAAVLKFPVEDTPRLAYADKLDENAGTIACERCDEFGFHRYYPDLNGQPNYSDSVLCSECGGNRGVSDGRRERAEFIRLQVELARMEPCNIFALAHGNLSPSAVDRTCDCRWHALRRRERALLEQSWAGNLDLGFGGGPWTDLVWSRGFVSGLSISWSDWRTHAAAILAAQPVERVKLIGRPYIRACQITSHEAKSDRMIYFLGQEHRPVRISKIPGFVKTWANGTRAEVEGKLCVARALLAHYWPKIEFTIDMPHALPAVEREAMDDYVLTEFRE